MTQPNCYLTMTSPLVTIVGLYSNVPENGYIDPDQADWFAGELAHAPTERPLIVTSHHPALSLERYHGGSAPMLQAIDTPIAASGRVPDLVAAGQCARLPALGKRHQRGDGPVRGGRRRRVLASARGA